MNVKLYADPKEKGDKVDERTKSIGLDDTYPEEASPSGYSGRSGIAEKVRHIFLNWR